MEIELIQTQLIALARLETNDGQIEGVKRNPRNITEEDMEKLKKSIREHPNMMALREMVVYPHGDKFVVLGGNMRLRALRDLGYDEGPCKVIPTDTPTDQLNAFIALDNGSFGAWDWDALANEWDDLPLGDWGVPSWPEAKDDGKSASGERPDLSDQLDYQFRIEITCVSEAEQEKMYNELTERGFQCRILTL